MAGPLPLYTSTTLGTLTGRDGGVFTLEQGIRKEVAEELKARSLDPSDTELQENTSDRKRFGEGSYEEWYSKERYPYVLLDTEGKLAAFIWYGPSVIPTETQGEWDTIAFRSYPPYRGAGLMSAFGSRILEVHAADFPTRRLWLETDAGNEAGLGLYRKLGFVEASRIKDGKRVVMVKE